MLGDPPVGPATSLAVMVPLALPRVYASRVRLLWMLLLVLQLEPIAGAAICAFASGAPSIACAGEAMAPLEASEARSAAPTPDEHALTANDGHPCPWDTICLRSTHLLTARTAAPTVVTLPSRAPDAMRSHTLLAADPIIPPLPPPIV